MNHRDLSKSIHLYLKVITSPESPIPLLFHNPHKSSRDTYSGSPRPHWYLDLSLTSSFQESMAFLKLVKASTIRTWSTYIHMWSITLQVVVPRCSKTLTFISRIMHTNLVTLLSMDFITRKVILLRFCLVSAPFYQFWRVWLLHINYKNHHRLLLSRSESLAQA